MLTVINGTKKDKSNSNLDLLNIYNKACGRASKAYSNDKSSENLSKLIYYWVKYLNLGYRLCDDIIEISPIEHIQEFFQNMEVIKELIKLLTPNELIRIFPITKRYDGARYQSKDYFTTMEALKEHVLDTPIGEAADHILWDYMDDHLM